MKKIFILLGIASLALGLVACDGSTGDTSKTPPIFSKIVVENEEPFDGTTYTTYFMEKEDEVEVEIHLLNPYQYTVTSIVINGYNYRFSKFETGSDFSTIIINIPVGSSLGDMVYTVEEIVYQDGDASITIPVVTENIFEVYVFKEHPTVALEGYNLEKNSLELDLLVTDSDSVTLPGSIRAVLYTNNNEVETILLTVGTQSVIFENLDADNIYEVKVFADYDLEDGNDVITNYLLYSGLYSTNANLAPTADITNLVVTANSVTFDVVYNDVDDITHIDGYVVGLFEEGEILPTQTHELTESETGLSFDVLLNDSNYQLKIISRYDLDNGLPEITDEVLKTVDFLTLPRVIPIPLISDLRITEDEVSFKIDIDDPNGVIFTETLIANIIVDGVVVQTAEFNDYTVFFEVFGLLSDFNFDIEIRASFDLNDGLLTQENQLIFYQSYTTASTLLPEITFGNVSVTQGYINVNLNVVDTDTVILDGLLTAKLYEDGTHVDTVYFSSTDTSIVFEYLAYFDYSYEIIVYTDYDLRDGGGEKSNYILINKILTSLTVKAPGADIKDVSATQDSIVLDVNVMDIDSTLIPLTAYARLYLGTTFVEEIELIEGLNNNKEFGSVVDLLSNTLYTIIVVADYDLSEYGDDPIEEEVLDTYTIRTESKTAPIATITDTTIGSTTFEFYVTITDADGTIVDGTTFAYLTNLVGDAPQQIPLSAGVNNYTFTGLLSEVEYTIEIATEYNLNSDSGNDDIVMAEISKYTLNKQLPSGYVDFVFVDEDTYTANITVIDNYSVINDGTLTAVLYIDDIPTAHVQPVTVGTSIPVTFTGLDSNVTYELRVEGIIDYNLNKGTPDIRSYMIADKTFTTVEKVAPSIELEAPVTGFSTITFDVVLSDPNIIIEGNATAYLYLGSELENSVAVQSENLIVGSNTIAFTGLPANTTYEIIIKTVYNADDLEGNVNLELAVFSSTTDEKTAPSVSISNIVLSQTSITFDVSGYDTFTVIDGDITAYLYDGITLIDSTVVSLALGTYTFRVNETDLLSNHEYEIVIKASYDLDDNINSFTDAVLDSETVTTLAKELPYISLTSENVYQDQVVLNFDFIDNDSVMINDNLIANLYIGDSVVASTSILNQTISFDISDLLSGFTFRIEVTGDYNLGDVDGNQLNKPIWSKEYQTSVNLAPNITVFNYVDDGYISANIFIEDEDNTYVSGLQIELYEDSVLLETISLELGNNSIEFAHMANKLKVYEMRIIESYNLRDGEGLQTESVFERIFVKFNNQIPLAEITNLLVTQDSVTFDVTAWDPDSVLEALTLKAILYQGDTPVGAPLDLTVGDNLGEQWLSILESDNEFRIVIVAEYDLDNGSGVLGSVLDTVTFTTISKDMPSVVVSNLNAGFHEITFDIDLTDTDSVIEGSATANIYEGSTLIDVFPLSDGVNNVSFTPLVANTVYTVKITTDYNLDDGAGQVDDYLFVTFNTTTDEKTAPTVAVSEIVVGHSTITFDTNLIDTHTVIDGDVTATLYINGVLEGQTRIIALGENTYSFDTLYANETYQIIITGSYNLDDGVTVEVDAELVSFSPTTSAYSLPFISSVSVATTENSIGFEIDFENTDNVILEDTLEAELYHGETLIATATVLNHSVNFYAYDLLANNEYTVKINANVNLREEVDTSPVLVFEETFTTSENFLPTFTLIDLVVSQTTVTVDYDLLDSSGVLVNLDEVAAAVIEFVLYAADGTTELDRQSGSLGLSQQIVFNEILDYDSMYEVRIESDYNLRDGTGNFINTSVMELVIGSHVKKAPEATAVISNGVVGTTDYTFDVDTTMLDVDTALVVDSFIAILYDNTGTAIAQSATLLVGSNVAIQFTGLTASTDYTIEIVYTYNLENGDGPIVIVPILDSVAFTTNP